MNDANPYNSAPTVSTNADAPADFRMPAVVASEALRRSVSGGQSPERAGISCCLERQPSLSRLRTPLKIIAVVSLVLGLSGLVAGPIILSLQKKSTPADQPILLTIAFCSSVGGILVMFLPTYSERWIVRKHLSQRDETTGLVREGIPIALEYAPTYSSLKILAEDVGLIYLQPGAGCIKIDGLSYNYVIQSKDVASLSLHSNRKTVLLSYRVGNEKLDLAILPRSVLAEFQRQTLGSSQTLFMKIREALKGSHLNF